MKNSVVLKICAVTLSVLLLSGYASVPANALKYIPILKSDIKQVSFPSQYPYAMAGQVEQETCPYLKSKLCWNPRAQLKTSREYGFGLGQTTVAYNSNGSVRFNNFLMVTHKYKELSNWKWQDRFNPKYQLMSLLLMMKSMYTFIKFPVANDYEKMAMTFEAYNGGLGGLLQDRALCMRIRTCNAAYWFNNISLYSTKSKKSMRGYGQSPFQISREYPFNILKIRMQKYEPFFNQ